MIKTTDVKPGPIISALDATEQLPTGLCGMIAHQSLPVGRIYIYINWTDNSGCYNNSSCYIHCACLLGYDDDHNADDDEPCKLTGGEHWRFETTKASELIKRDTQVNDYVYPSDKFTELLSDVYKDLYTKVGSDVPIILNLSILVHNVSYARPDDPVCQGMEFSQTYDICLEDIQGIEIGGYEFVYSDDGCKNL
jgi:hypothetical protein